MTCGYYDDMVYARSQRILIYYVCFFFPVWFLFLSDYVIAVLHLLSLQGASEKKLDATRLRRIKDEEEKKQIDIEEAKYHAQKRKEAIEKAKTQQYYQTDRVKKFHVSRLNINSLFLLVLQYTLVESFILFNKDLTNGWTRHYTVYSINKSMVALV